MLGYEKKSYFCSLKTAGCGAVGSALRSGRRGRKFESCHPDFFLSLISKVNA